MYNIILAVSNDGFIANNEGEIPWKISNDMKWFKMNTYNSSVIMGSKTWETFKKPLTKRKNVILSSKNIYSEKTINSICEAKKYLDMNGGWVIGGKIAEQFFQKNSILLLTYVDVNIESGIQIHLPKIQCIWESKILNENGYNYKFTINKII